MEGRAEFGWGRRSDPRGLWALRISRARKVGRLSYEQTQWRAVLRGKPEQNLKLKPQTLRAPPPTTALVREPRKGMKGGGERGRREETVFPLPHSLPFSGDPQKDALTIKQGLLKLLGNMELSVRGSQTKTTWIRTSLTERLGLGFILFQAFGTQHKIWHVVGIWQILGCLFVFLPKRTSQGYQAFLGESCDSIPSLRDLPPGRKRLLQFPLF